MCLIRFSAFRQRTTSDRRVYAMCKAVEYHPDPLIRQRANAYDGNVAEYYKIGRRTCARCYTHVKYSLTAQLGCV